MLIYSERERVRASTEVEQRERERERGRETIASRLCTISTEPIAGLIPGTLRSSPELKSRVGC